MIAVTVLCPNGVRKSTNTSIYSTTMIWFVYGMQIGEHMKKQEKK